jgi:hypothetical protein
MQTNKTMAHSLKSCEFLKNSHCKLGYHGGRPHPGNCAACINAGENTPEQAAELAARAERAHPAGARRVSGCCDSAKNYQVQ